MHLIPTSTLSEAPSPMEVPGNVGLEEESSVADWHLIPGGSSHRFGRELGLLAAQCDSTTYERIRSEHDADLFYQVFRAVAERDPAHAASLLDFSWEKSVRDLCLQTLIHSWIDQDPRATYAWLEGVGAQLEGPEFESHSVTILSALALVDPEAAAVELQSIQNPGSREILLVQLAEGWSRKDADAAFEWLTTLSETDISSRTLNACYRNMMEIYMEQEPMRAAVAIAELGSDALKRDLLPEMIGQLGAIDLKEALDWSQSLDASGIRDLGMRQMIEQFGDTEPELILDSLLSRPEAGAEEAEMMHSLFRSVVMLGPDRFAPLLEQTPSSEQSGATEALVSRWIDQDATAAADWVGTLESGKVLDGGAVALAHHFINDEPTQALRWAEQVEDPGVRSQLFSDLVQFADEDDLGLLQQAVDSTMLSVQERSQIDSALSARRDEFSPLVLPQ